MGTRQELIDSLIDMRRYLAADETELRKLMDSAVSKLKEIDDSDYAVLDLYHDFQKVVRNI